MPVLMFTTAEVAHGLISEQRRLSKEILELADLKVRPLDPGEGVAARHHKIARLAKQAAEAFQALDALLRSTDERIEKLAAAEESSEAGPVGPTNPEAN